MKITLTIQNKDKEYTETMYLGGKDWSIDEIEDQVKRMGFRVAKEMCDKDNKQWHQIRHEITIPIYKPKLTKNKVKKLVNLMVRGNAEDFGTKADRLYTAHKEKRR